MKTNLLIATVMLMSAASFGQQTETKTTQTETVKAAKIKDGSDANAQVYASTIVKSKAAGSAENQVIQVKKQAKKTTSSVEKKASGQAISAVDKNQEATKGNTSASASLQANSSAKAGYGDNKISQDASSNTALSVSSSDAKSRVDGLNQEAKATAQAKTNESLNKTASVKNEADKSVAETAGNARTDMDKVQTTAKSSVNAGSSTAVKTAGGIKQSVKPHSVKVHSQIKTNAAIKIK